jgi:hypothetical protein
MPLKTNSLQATKTNSLQATKTNSLQATKPIHYNITVYNILIISYQLQVTILQALLAQPQSKCLLLLLY